MLSSALQKANTAVLLDNANNFEGAMEAYGDACVLLGHVMLRAGVDEDKRKLMAIRDTYSRRIEELKALSPLYKSNEKELPAPPGDDFSDGDPSEGDGASKYEVNEILASRPPPRRDSLLPGGSSSVHDQRQYGYQQHRPERDWHKEDIEEEIEINEPVKTRNHEDQNRYVSQNHDHNLNYRNEHSRPEKSNEIDPVRQEEQIYDAVEEVAYVQGVATLKQLSQPVRTITARSTSPRLTSPLHTRNESEISTSWLNTFDESEGSASGSSGSSGGRKMRKRIELVQKRAHEASLDDMGMDLDAAVEAAWEGFSPMSDRFGPDQMASMPIDVRRNSQADEHSHIPVTKEIVDNDESLDPFNQVPSKHALGKQPMGRENIGVDYGKVQEQLHQDYRLDDFHFEIDTQRQNPAPRQSDVSQVDEPRGKDNINVNRSLGYTSADELYSHSRRASSIPDSISSKQQFPSVRERRLSGRPLSIISNQPLTVETLSSIQSGSPERELHNLKISEGSANYSQNVAENTKRLIYALEQDIKDLEDDNITYGNNHAAEEEDEDEDTSDSRDRVPSMAQFHNFTYPASTTAAGLQDNFIGSPRSTTPSSPYNGGHAYLRQMKSAQSLRTGGSIGQDVLSPTTIPPTASSISGQFRSVKGLGTTPTGSQVSLPTGGLPSGGYHLFDSKLHSPTTPNITASIANAPIPLENMPNEQFSKPFWLMRCLYQSINHPRGGYLTPKLFVPRDIWLMKGVKLKGIEEKVQVCDSLTAALTKLAVIDKSEADSLLREMQDLEIVMGRAETILSKKLGSDVGASGLVAMFKGESSNSDQQLSENFATKSSAGTSSGKVYLSWKKLRSKNSASTVLNSSYSNFANTGKVADSDANHDSTIFGAQSYSNGEQEWSKKKNNNNGVLTFVGPYAAYMAALAKLFDAAQVLGKEAFFSQQDYPFTRAVYFSMQAFANPEISEEL